MDSRLVNCKTQKRPASKTIYCTKYLVVKRLKRWKLKHKDSNQPELTIWTSWFEREWTNLPNNFGKHFYLRSHRNIIELKIIISLRLCKALGDCSGGPIYRRHSFDVSRFINAAQSYSFAEVKKLKACLHKSRPVTSLGHQEGRRIFWEGPKYFEIRPIFSKYIQHTFPGGAKNFLRGLRPTWLRVCIKEFAFVTISNCYLVLQE